ncbi:MAG: hypothetical protein IT373_06335 [Polyangiaceae bacterium]|nr:hypothetical protein [Polyangiaceae bacterium]
MSLYGLSIDPALVQEAETLVSLEGRAFPTLVVFWESQLLGQTWETILVTDYSVPLPPLPHGKRFNEVRVAAYTGEVPTKFLYFGTELTSAAPRVAPQMENLVGHQRTFQEYLIEENTCPIGYLDLITSTPRIYGNGPQDYYSPPIRVERFDAEPGADMMADHFPEIVAGLPKIPGEQLIDPSYGHWQGARFVGTKAIAILRQGKVAGLYRRTGRAEKEVVPPEVVRRDPHGDVRDGWVALDIGATGTVIAIGSADRHEFVRLGAVSAPQLARDYENPSEVYFGNLQRVLKAWRDRVILPLTPWGDVLVGHAARSRLQVQGKERALRAKAMVAELGVLPERLERGDEVRIAGRSDIDVTMRLDRPAPPVFDEEGIGPEDPFDPVELYAYYVGLHVNARERGIYLRYAVGMPTGWPQERRQQVIAQVRRGIVRSLPAGMVAYDDLDFLQVVDAGPNVLSFAAYAFRVFGVVPKGDPVPYVAIDAGATETSVMCGRYREGTADEIAGGLERVVEHGDPSVLPYGGERLLHRVAYKVFAASLTSMRHNDIVFEPPRGEDLVEGAEDRLNTSLEAQINVRLLKDAVRSILESARPQPVPDLVQLFARDGRVRDVRIMVDRAALSEWLRGQLSELAVEIKEAIARNSADLAKGTKGNDPYSGLRVLLGGRLGMNTFLQDRLQAVLPQGVRLHRFKEPDDTNLAAPTVKLAVALGILTMRFQHMGPSKKRHAAEVFTYQVGRARQGKLLTVLDQKTTFDAWHELGACTRPDVTVLYASQAKDGEELNVDDPRVQRVTCMLGYDAVGYRIYVRAVGGGRIELGVGPPGGRPDEEGPFWAIDLASGASEAVSQSPRG